jgi:late competence protein required for DNA uptake (superfamily II DNA/RNA helicase)
LVREHLQWQYEDLTKRQVDALVYAAVAKRLEKTREELTSLRRELENKDDAAKRRRLESIELFRSQALTLLVRISDELEEAAGSN